MVPELAQLLAFQYIICTLDKVIAPQETVIGNVYHCPMHFLATEIKSHAPSNSLQARITHYPDQYMKEIGRERTNQASTVYTCIYMQSVWARFWLSLGTN